MSGISFLQKKIATKKLDSVTGLTFSASTIDLGELTKDGENVGLRVTCANGKKITFWESNLTSVVQDVPGTEDTLQVIPGTRISPEADDFGYFVLFPKDSKSGGYWKK